MATVPIPAEHPHSTGQSSAPPLLASIRSAWEDPSRRASVFGAIGATALLGFLFWENLRHFVQVWANDENYSHGFLVPLISLYFANEAARKGPVSVRSGTWIGSILITLALAIKLATIVIPFPVVSDYGFLMALAGTCALLAGSDALKRYWFAFFFLGFMVPLPVALYSMIANPLQLLVSQLAASMLNAVGIPTLCEGNMITLPGDNQLFVAEACSGMRQLTGFLALTTAWAFLSARPLFYRTLLVLSSVPIAMTANVVRVTLTGVITYRFDPKYASGAFHTIEGLAMMGLGLMMLATFSWTLDQLGLIARGKTRD
ncbi:exosortase/archaeosortase family protein [Tundrisphaera lichenicola]|uniref:exosortase/archaeosortase family protein n=1 Tax=Tundrisphaera lichenicola TaxID=2029860 RepID=UPI003EB6E02C